jgi:hypothetical protein
MSVAPYNAILTPLDVQRVRIRTFVGVVRVESDGMSWDLHAPDGVACFSHQRDLVAIMKGSLCTYRKIGLFKCEKNRSETTKKLDRDDQKTRSSP